ncbi:MAG: outer membrane protein precursor-like protein [Ramlibacter sp.]|jgi:hypothetical protein|nr:outer membrane protein precursor-like protein [Ramlibacter sp.]MDB5914564.1 outer membrane protein precursor-like protein [Ramlibacter sp.]
MTSQRILLGVVIGLVSLTVSAQTNTLRWRNGGTSVGLQVGQSSTTPLRAQELNVSLQGRSTLAPELGVYGRIGTPLARNTAVLGAPGFDSGPSYGVGVSWDLSRSASASLGWDSYDIRSASGESSVRSARLGLQWRY